LPKIAAKRRSRQIKHFFVAGLAAEKSKAKAKEKLLAEIGEN
jgi:hypothetical protein